MKGASGAAEMANLSVPRNNYVLISGSSVFSPVTSLFGRQATSRATSSIFLVLTESNAN